MLSVRLEILRSSSDEIRLAVAAMARSLEASERWPAAKVELRAEEAPEDDPDRAPGTWYFVRVGGLPRGGTLYAESKGQPFCELTLRVETASDVEPILAALRQGFAAQAGPLTWMEPAAFPAEWSRLERETAAVLGVEAWLPSAFLMTESFLGVRFGYLFVDPGLRDPVAEAAGGGFQIPGLTQPRHAIPVGPMPDGETASSLVTNAGRVPAPDEILVALLGDGANLSRAELVASGAGEVLPFALPPLASTVRMEMWAAGPWRVRIGRSTRAGDERFQIAVQHLQGGDRALFASSQMEIWKPTSEAVFAAATAPSGEMASAMVERLLARISTKR